MGWQLQYLDHMQIVCTLYQTDNHASSLIICRSDALPAAQPTVSKHCIFYSIIQLFALQLGWVQHIKNMTRKRKQPNSDKLVTNDYDWLKKIQLMPSSWHSARRQCRSTTLLPSRWLDFPPASDVWTVQPSCNVCALHPPNTIQYNT